MMRGWPAMATIVPAVVALTLACHGGALLRGEQYAFRDAAHYYYPLHQKVQQEWSAGRWPLWDPSENAGMPLLGNPTAAVLYPGKLLFAVAPYPLAARLYVVGHNLLAFATMFATLRCWGMRAIGSAIGGLAYAFGAPVLFQYCNVIYLVGAAWAPLGMLAADRWVRLGDRRAILGLAAVLAMEALGGDPETAYLTGLFAASYAAFLAFRRPSSGDGPNKRRWPALGAAVAILATWSASTLAIAALAADWRSPTPANGLVPPLPWAPWVGPMVASAWSLAGLVVLHRWRRAKQAGRRPTLGPALAGLAISAALAAALSAAQLLPALEFAGRSDRVLGEGTHEIYSFSLDPARLAEFLWPNLDGTIFEGNYSWIDAANPAGKPAKPWVSSLYLGGLTLALALATLPIRGGPPWLGWVAAVGLFSLAASLGEYASPIAAARHWGGAASVIGGHDPSGVGVIRADGRLRDGDGGLYWALATFLPGFRSFRFPSKLLTFAAFALATLAARGWDALASGDLPARRRLIAWSSGLLGLTVVAWVATSIGGRGYLSRLADQSRESLGSLDVEGAFRDLRAALLQGGLVFGVVLVLAASKVARGPIAGALAMTLMTGDLAVANARLVLTVPQRLFDEKPEILEMIERSERESPSDGPFRVHRMPRWEPPGWAEGPSARRAPGVLEWERGTLQPKYGSPLGLQYTTTTGASELRDYEAFFRPYFGQVSPRTARMGGVPADRDVVIYPRFSFDLWNTRYFILPFHPGRWTDRSRGYASFLDRTELLHPDPAAFLGEGGRRKRREWVDSSDFQVRRNLAPHPRAWISRVAIELKDPPKPGENPADPTGIADILIPKDVLTLDPSRAQRDPSSVAWLEPGRRGALAGFLDGRPPGRDESVRVASQEPDRVELRAKLDRPGLVVLADVDYPGWSLAIDGRPAPIERANRMMRAAAVEAGVHTLAYTYRPASFRAGLVLSGLTLAALGLHGCLKFAGRRIRG